MSEIVKTGIDFSDTAKEIVFTPSTGNDFLTADNADQRISLLVKNTNATQNATVTVKAGDGALASKGDAVVAVGAGKSVVLPMCRLESARVKVLTGASKGTVAVASSVDAGGNLSGVLLGAISIA